MPKRKLKLDTAALSRLLAPTTKEVIVYGDDRDLDLLDAMDSAYRAEHERWCARCVKTQGYEVFRNGSSDGIDESRDPAEDTIIRLTKREASNYDRAEEWSNAFAGRAAMRAALKAAAK